MEKQLSKFQIKIIAFILKRFKSKSPKGYKILTRICIVASILMAAFIAAFKADLLPTVNHPIFATIKDLCVVGGAAFTALGLGSASTTTDLDLMTSDERQ